MPQFDAEAEKFISFDGTPLGLSVWEAEGTQEPEHIVVGIHGMNDWAGAYQFVAPIWAKAGVTVYAYDQRGFGRSPNKGIWPDEELMRKDLRTAITVARQKHPNAILTAMGISMGGAVAMSIYNSDEPLDADRLILSGPGLRGWGSMRLAYRPSLWLSARIRPSWVVTPPRGVRIEPSDNWDRLEKIWANPLMTRSNRIDQVHGVVSVMESGHKGASKLPENTLLSYGANDYVIPKRSVRRTFKTLPGHVRGVYYENGYHMLLRDKQSDVVAMDYLAFMRNPDQPLPSGSPDLPFRE